MHFAWNDTINSWFLDASEYTGYEKNLAKIIYEQLSDCKTLCDMGCGMALTDFALADKLEDITCVDMQKEAADFINDRAKSLGITNIHAHHSNGLDYDGQWDAIMSLFSAPIEQVCANYYSKVNRRLIVVTHDTASIKGMPYMIKKCSNVEDTAAYLEENGYSFTVTRHCLDFSQPHRSFEEAMKYTATFTHGAPADKIEEITRARIVETGVPIFPYKTPKTRHFGLFVIEKQ